jgi:peptide/nickel transport system permease protein
VSRYLLRRLVGALLTLLGVTVLVFVMLRLIPGDAISATLGTEAGAMSPQQRAALEDYYGVGEPPVQQYFSWLGSVVTGNLGIAQRSGEPVSTLIADAFPVTLELAILSTLLGAGIGVIIGVASASKPGSLRDGFGQAFGFVGLITPSFVIATAIVTIVATRLRYFPNAAAYAGFFESPGLNLQQMLFPSLTLSLVIAATVLRTTRSAYLEVSEKDFVRFARSKGVPDRRIRWRHVLPNALIPIVTITGIQFGYLLGGTVIIEQIFSLPGLGRLVLTGIEQREYALVQSVVLVIAAGFVVVNLLVDLLYAKIDPRVTLR